MQCMNYWIIWKRSRIDISVHLLVDLFDELFGHEMMLLLRLSIVLEFFNSLHVLLVLVTPHPANFDSLMDLGQSSTSAISSRFPEACLKRRSSCAPICLGVLLLVLSRCKLSFLRTILFFIFFDNFHNACFQRRLVHNDGLLDSVCQNSFLRYEQVNSVFCSFFRSWTNLMIHLPRFLGICNYFCCAGIVVETYQE